MSESASRVTTAGRGSVRLASMPIHSPMSRFESWDLALPMGRRNELVGSTTAGTGNR
jgi:hypothetical protein